MADKPKNEAFLERFRELVTEFTGGRHSAFAERTGVSPVTVMGYIQGRNLPGFEIIERICTACGVAPNWLVMGWAPKYAGEKPSLPQEIRIVDLAGAGDLDPKDFVTVPVLSQEAWRDSDEGILLVGPDTTEGFTVSAALPGTRLVAVRQIEASMQPEIEPDDLCLVDLEERAPARLEGRLVLAELDGLVTARRYHEGLLISNNARHFPPRRVGKKKLLGAILEIRRNREGVWTGKGVG